MPLWPDPPSRSAPAEPNPAAAAAERSLQWQRAIERGSIPPFVRDRLTAAAEGRTPWLSTMTPAELLLARSHGVRPVATVSGTCWYHYGWSWTKGHAEGWHAALDRMKQEAIAAGANAIVDVKLRTLRLKAESSMDYTVVGTAVTIDGLPPSRHPVVATVPAIAFVRLLEAGIVTTGVAIGAHYAWYGALPSDLTGGDRWTNGPCRDLTTFWEDVRRQALADLKVDAGRLGNGVLAHTHFGQLLDSEKDERGITPILGRHIVIGTAVQCTPYDTVPHGITPVVDMRDDLSPLHDEQPHGHTAYPTDGDEGGEI